MGMLVCFLASENAGNLGSAYVARRNSHLFVKYCCWPDSEMQWLLESVDMQKF